MESETEKTSHDAVEEGIHSEEIPVRGEESPSVEELSSFDISDDDNPLREQLKEKYLERLEQESRDTNGVSTTSSSRITSLNNGSIAGNIMETPGSVFTAKTSTTRPSSRNTVTGGYTSDRSDQRLDKGKAVLMESNPQIPKRGSPRRLHRVLAHNQSETDLSFTSDTNVELNTVGLMKILNADEIQDNTGDRISVGADITRLKEELINCKVQIQLQKEIIRNNLLDRAQNPLSEEIMGRLNSLSINEDPSLKERCQVLQENVSELERINQVLIEQQDQNQREYTQWMEMVREILVSLEAEVDENASNMGRMLKEVLNRVKTMDHSVVRILSGGDDVSVGNVSEATDATNTSLSTTQGLGNELVEKDHMIQTQEAVIKQYKTTIGDFVNLVEQTLNGYVNEFIGFHSDFVNHSRRVIEEASIEEVVTILRELVAKSDAYQREGRLINFQEVRGIMDPVWRHNGRVCEMIVERYEDMVKENKELRRKRVVVESPKSDIVTSKEIIVLRQQVASLERDLAAAKDSDGKLRLEGMVRKWKQSEEALAFERRSNHIKVAELEAEIRRLRGR